MTVLVMGDINVDLLMPVPEYPRPGEDTVAPELYAHSGGSAANTAAVLAKLGLGVRLIGRTGRDGMSTFARQELAEVGVSLSAVLEDPVHPTRQTFIPVTPDGERTMFCYRGANDYTEPGQITPDLFPGARLLHLSGYALMNSPQREAALHAVEFARAVQVPVSLDTAWAPAMHMTGKLRTLIPYITLCTLGLDEAEALSGTRDPEAAADALLRSGIGQVGLKLGTSGCMLADGTCRIRLPPFKVDSIDATGAGDAFAAGLIFGWLGGESLPVCGTIASALGALATTCAGAGASLPGREDLYAFLDGQLVAGNHTAWISQALSALHRPTPSPTVSRLDRPSQP